MQKYASRCPGSMLLIWMLCACLVNRAAAQYENVWIFGIGAGLDFNVAGNPLPVTSSLGNGYNVLMESSASVCDGSGSLLFYTEGSYVYDRQHNIMPGGSEITGIPSQVIGISDKFAPTQSTVMGSLIVPVPGEDSLYYLFSLISTEWTIGAGRLYYSIVDMRLNNGLGDLVPGRRGVLLDSNMTEAMTGVVGDQCNVWVLTISKPLVSLAAFSVTESGIAPPVYSPLKELSHVLCVSPDRARLFSGFELYDFNPVTGRVSNPLTMIAAAFPTANAACFSPDSRLMYVKPIFTGQLFQYDLSSGDPAVMIASRTLVFGGLANFAFPRLAPDGRIYYTEIGGQTIGRINEPDQLGAACMPQSGAITLPAGMRASHGFINSVPVLERSGGTTSSTRRDACYGGHQSVMLEAAHQDGRDYIWQDGEERSRRYVDSSGIYWVSYYTAPCTMYTDSFIVDIRRATGTRFSAVICANEWYEFGGRMLNEPGTYRDTFTAANGCDSVTTLDLAVLPVGGISIRHRDGPVPCIGSAVDMGAGGGSDYVWFSDGVILAAGQSVSVPIPASAFSLQVSGLLDNGCRDTASAIFRARPCCELFYPDAFTPNGDGRNDVFRPIGDIYTSRYQMHVFNRWGEPVFSGTEMRHGWDGSYKGDPAMPGVYFYSVSYECPEAGHHSLNGEVTLIR